jgi:hypothetical protein
MRWITREQVRVGRMGCAWLIRTFIDSQAEFFFTSGDRVLDEAKRLGATPFHAEGADLAQQGDDSSFEVILRRYNLADEPALALIGRIVNTADVKNSRYQQPEGPGLKAITEGILALYATDEERIQAGMAVYDALYAYAQEMVRRGRPHGAFTP